MLFVYALFELLIYRDANACQNTNTKQAIAEKMIITFVTAAAPSLQCLPGAQNQFQMCCFLKVLKVGLKKLGRNIQHGGAYLRLAAKGRCLFISSKR